MKTPSGAHILVFPFPAQGHMLPLLDLTHLLASHGFPITILVTSKNLPLLTPLLSSHPSIQTLILPFPSHPSIPAGIENAKDLPMSLFPAMIAALGGLQSSLSDWFRSHPSPPAAIISDIFLGWTHHLAGELGIPRIVFSPSGALTLSLQIPMWKNLPKRNDPENQNEVVSFPELPNCPEYPWWQLSPLYRSFVEGGPFSEFLRDNFLANSVSWGLVVNSFSEMEGIYLEHLKKDLGHDRIWAVGPIQPVIENPSGPIRGGPNSVNVDYLLSWLDKCEDGQVVYVCFGSQAILRNDQMEELALALEKSGVHFVWSYKEPTKVHVEGGYGEVPPGFTDRVAGRGLVIKGWAPQVVILRHRAVGAFLTHCGWNSVLESVVAGVPMLAWPMAADQFANKTLLVEQLKVAVTVCEGAGTVPDSAELSRVLAESVSGDRVDRRRAVELRKAAVEAIGEGGSSVKDLEGLMGNLVKLGVNGK
ncbi:hypothetical protein UlMin_008650 [Ulmus minor]